MCQTAFHLFRQSICTLIHGPTTIHQKAALLFNIHSCILMGYFNNNTGDNNVFLCNIPVKIDDTASFYVKARHGLTCSPPTHICMGCTHAHKHTRTHVHAHMRTNTTHTHTLNSSQRVHEVCTHKHTDILLSGGLSRCNHIHFVTRLVNDLKLDFMHAFILIHSLVFFILAGKTLRTIKNYPILQLSL